MTPHELIQSITAGKFLPVYYFHGSEDYRIVEAAKFIARQFLPKSLHQTNYRRIDARKTSSADLMAELSVYPMLGEKQVFSVTDFQHYKPAEVERILRLMTPADPSRLLILSSPSAKNPRKDSAFFKAVTKSATEIEFKRLSSSEVERNVLARLGRQNVMIDPDARTLLTQLLAGDRGAIETEVDKLIDYKGSGQRITVDDVRFLTAGYSVHSIFDLGDTVMSGDAAATLRLARSLIADGNSPTGILFFLFQHLLSVYLVKNGKHLEPYRKWLEPKLRTQGDQHDNPQIEAILIRLAQADAEMRRTTIMKPDMLLEQFLVAVTAQLSLPAGPRYPGLKRSEARR